MRKPRTLSDLNPHVRANKKYIEGLLDATQLIDEMYSSVSTHKYLLGDCVLLKLNLINKRQVRVNKRRKAT